MKLRQSRVRLQLRKKFFSMKVVKELSGEVVDTSSLEVFKVRLDEALCLQV